MVILVFLTKVLGALLDPIALVGYVGCGFFRQYPVAVGGAAAWAIAMEALASQLARQRQLTFWFGDTLPHRLVGAMLVASLVWLAVRAYRRKKIGSAAETTSLSESKPE